MNNFSCNGAAHANPSDIELCQRFGVECRIVGDVYDVDQQERPIPEHDRVKWMVTTPAGPFPRALVEAIPLAESESECVTLVVKYLMLRERDALLDQGERKEQAKFPAIPTPVYLTFIMDQTFWSGTGDQMVYATDLVIEVDGKRYEQDQIDPNTFMDTAEVVIVDGTVYEEWKRLHPVREHFANWISGHQPAANDKDSA